MESIAIEMQLSSLSTRIKSLATPGVKFYNVSASVWRNTAEQMVDYITKVYLYQENFIFYFFHIVL